MTSELCVDGLDATVAIHRDGLGIPHCRAATEHDAFFAQGFVQAEDRLGQLEYDRRRAYGRWAEIAGPAAVPFDVFARRCGIERAAQTEYASLSASA
ncbi:MAG: penicillin acylase family protein, partial [Actinobacteria bacterium]